jgi:branched-chain amino acid transport system ATP-binding protein
MLAIGRALMARPRLLTLDEPSIGLAPKLVTQVLEAVTRIRDTGVTVLIVEQNAAHTLRISDRAYVLESGDIVVEGVGRELVDDARVRTAYLGM